MNARRWLITLCACVLVFAALAGYKFMQIKAAIAFGESFPEPSESVQALIVSSSPVHSHITTIGEVVAPEAMELRNELEGRVSAINMTSGGKVKKGDVLLQLDISEESARLNAARASANLTRLKLERMNKLLPSKAVSEDSVDQARAEHDIALASVGQWQATIDKKTLRAPFDAVVGLHDIEVGEYLEANSMLVMLLGTQDFVWVDFNLPLTQGRVALGDNVSVKIPGADGEGIEATVIASNPAVSAQSRNLRYRARVAAHPALLPNAVVNVEVPTGSSTLIQVPSPAVLRDEMGTYVFVLTPEDSGEGYRASRRAVTLGSEEGEITGITAGLAPGDRIATHGAFKLRHAMLAYVRERPAKPVAADADSARGE